MPHYWNKNYICPFYISSHKNRIKCEEGSVSFSGKQAILTHVDMFCAAWEWEDCPQAKKIMEKYK